jgi:Tol biopolymer transport system component
MRRVRARTGVVAVKRQITLVLVAATTLLAPIGVTGPAVAKVPGPNGQILFGRYSPALDESVLYTVNPDGSHLHRVIPGPPRITECPHWSPDGSLIVSCPDSFADVAFLIDPDTGAIQHIPARYPSLKLACVLPSPDSRRLACGNVDVAADPNQDGLYTVRSSDGGGLERVTTDPGGMDSPGDYSPNGKQIVFLREGIPTRPTNANQALFVVNVDGTGLHRITPWSARLDVGLGPIGGSWSPDGTKILYGDRSSLFLVNPDGSDRMKLPIDTTGFRFPFGPSWSPDGTRISFGLITETSPGTGQEGIFTAKANGTDVRQVTDSPTFDEDADWGPHPLAT